MLVLANLCVRLFVLLHVLLENRDLMDRDTFLYTHKPVRDRRIFTYLIYYVISMKNITCRSEIAIKIAIKTHSGISGPETYVSLMQ